MKRRSLCLIFIVFFLALMGKNHVEARARKETKQDKHVITPLKPVMGWNLGNSLDTHDLPFNSQNPYDFETFWKNPPVTEKLFVDVKKAGFEAVRIPVTWYPHMDRTYRINTQWMDRVQEVVDYGIKNGLYVILNAHHEDWYDPAGNNMERALSTMEILWRQIGERFADYDEHLFFEGMNEPRLRNTPYEWNTGTADARKNINILNKKFVGTIRSMGGNNAIRYLLVPAYCAIISSDTLTDLELPSDNRVIVSVHLYQPLNFAQNSGRTSSWDPKNTGDTANINQAMADLERYLIQKKIPVMITEFGAVDKQNELDRIAWVRYIRGKTSRLGISCFWWDTGGRKDAIDREYSLINRYTGEWLFPGITAALTASYTGK